MDIVLSAAVSKALLLGHKGNPYLGFLLHFSQLIPVDSCDFVEEKQNRRPHQ